MVCGVFADEVSKSMEFFRFVRAMRQKDPEGEITWISFDKNPEYHDGRLVYQGWVASMTGDNDIKSGLAKVKIRS